MADTDLRALQYAELDILKEFVRICDTHHLTYYLGWGSCLGAVRHQGFIPWDDDIDILMPIKDYDKLKEICKQELQDRYFYQDRETDPNYFLNFAKIRSNDTTFMLEIFSKIDIHWGVNIDIFPLYDYDATISNECKDELIQYRTIAYKYAYTKRKFYKTKNLKEKFKVFARCLWYMKYPEQKRMNMLLDMEQRLRQKQGEYYIDSEAIDTMGPIAKEVFAEGTLLPFEDIQVRVPKDYDTYLTVAFGDDYMVVPQEGSDKIYYHEDVIVDLEHSYTDYRK